MPSLPVSNDKMNRVVVAFLDGRRLKGYVFNFSALKETFRLFPSEPGDQKSGSDVSMKDLKAVFFVKDFAGNRDNNETTSADGVKHGRKIFPARRKPIVLRNSAFSCFRSIPTAITFASSWSTKTFARSK
jgi:hypothetical protein